MNHDTIDGRVIEAYCSEVGRLKTWPESSWLFDKVFRDGFEMIENFGRRHGLSRRVKSYVHYWDNHSRGLSLLYVPYLLERRLVINHLNEGIIDHLDLHKYRERAKFLIGCNWRLIIGSRSLKIPDATEPH